MTLREKQEVFAGTIATFILWILQQDLSVTLADGSIDRKRKFKKAGIKMVGLDAQHMENSCHYVRLAQDLNLFLHGMWLDQGTEPEWKMLGEKWESMHPLARWGGRFGDANHFSFEHEGKK